MWATPSKRKHVKYREANRVSAARKYEERSEWLRMQKNEPCMDCGGTFLPCQMDFDHRDETTKKFVIGPSLTRSITSLEAEIVKCDLVCANCHRLRTHLRRKERSASNSQLMGTRSSLTRDTLTYAASNETILG